MRFSKQYVYQNTTKYSFLFMIITPSSTLYKNRDNCWESNIVKVLQIYSNFDINAANNKII